MQQLVKQHPTLSQLSLFKVAASLHAELQAKCCRETSKQKDLKNRFELLLNSITSDQVSTIKIMTGATAVTWMVTGNDGRQTKRTL